MTSEANHSDSMAVAERVRALMARHGIGKRQQTTELCRILALSFSQGHRKLRGSSPWTFTQIRKVAEAFGEPAAQLVGTHADEPSLAGAVEHEAVLAIAGVEYRCTAWIGAALGPGESNDFVAYAYDEGWRVVRCEGLPQTGAHEVAQIVIRPRRNTPGQPSVAVVDGDVQAANALADYLRQNGFAVTTFDTLQAFEAALVAQTFGAIVTDWLFGRETAAAAIEAVRQSASREAPIFVLTGELLTGKASESEISEVIRRFDVACYEKPARLAILVADLSKRLHRV